ncbi:Bacillolysin [bacterium HR21]|nr:Bacillolysin [bacterium HR21]
MRARAALLSFVGATFALASVPHYRVALSPLPPAVPTVPTVAEFLQRSTASLADAPAAPIARFAWQPLQLTSRVVTAAGSPVRVPLPLQGLTPRVAFSPQGTPSWVERPLGIARMVEVPGPTRSSPARWYPDPASVLQQLRLHREFLKLQDPVRELRLLSAQSDELGLHHLRFQQLYEGIPIWGADLYVHIRSDGTLSLLNGRYLPTPVGAPTQPRLSPAEALERARDYVQRQTVLTPLPALPGLPSAEPSATLVLFPHPVTGAVFLCYEVNLHANLLEDYTLFVDALDGTIRWRILNTCSWHRHTSLSFPSDVSLPVHAMPRRTVAAGTFVDASGTDANGVTRSFRVYRHDDGMYYMIWDLPSLDRSGSQLPNRVKGGAVTLTANNSDIDPQNPQVYHITSPDNTWRDPVAVSAHYNAFISDRYYRTTHTRNSLDGQGGTVISIIHATYRGQPMSNAYWNGGLKIMVYGDGDGYLYKPFAAALDVAAHEMTHGVTQHSANLVYQFQPGALNESFSDIFAIMVDRDDFLLGEDLQGPGSSKIATRDIANPSNPNVESPQPSHMSQYQNLPIDQDNGGVHINSGIPNRAAYLIIQALGREKTERIYYRALTQYLTRTSEFIDCRRAVIRSAQELYGQAEANACAQAFDAVGITDSGGGGGGGNEVPPVQGGTPMLALIVGPDGLLALVRTDTWQGGVISTADPRTHALVGNDGFPLSQLSTPRAGDRIYFVNKQGKLAYADLTQQQFYELTLPLSNLRNACISSDGRVASLVTTAIDRSIYLTDGQTVARLELLPEAPDGGRVTTIWLADVMSWTPNMRQPRLAFDAFNVLPLQGDTLAYWNIYEAYLTATPPPIYELIPPSPREFSLGNITYSNTDPDVVAFNYIDHGTGTMETIVANLQTKQIAALGTSQWSYQGQPLLDVQRPSFSPDNRFLALVAPQHRLLLVADLQSGQVGAVENQAALYHPRWFSLGGTGIALPAAAEHAVYVRALPSGELSVRYSLPEATAVELELVNLLGTRIALLQSQRWQAAGTYEEHFQLPLASGVYILRCRIGDRLQSCPFVWLR